MIPQLNIFKQNLCSMSKIHPIKIKDFFTKSKTLTFSLTSTGL